MTRSDRGTDGQRRGTFRSFNPGGGRQISPRRRPVDRWAGAREFPRNSEGGYTPHPAGRPAAGTGTGGGRLLYTRQVLGKGEPPFLEVLQDGRRNLQKTSSPRTRSAKATAKKCRMAAEIRRNPHTIAPPIETAMAIPVDRRVTPKKTQNESDGGAEHEQRTGHGGD